MSSEAAALTEQIAGLLAEHTDWRPHLGGLIECTCGSVMEPGRVAAVAHRAHVATLLAARLADSRPAVTEAAITEAEQRGREDNADHGMCYVHGLKALAGKLAAAWDEGYTDCLAGDTCRCHGNPYRLSPTGDDSGGGPKCKCGHNEHGTVCFQECKHD